jgi:hypothetical protein
LLSWFTGTEAPIAGSGIGPERECAQEELKSIFENRRFSGKPTGNGGLRVAEKATGGCRNSIHASPAIGRTSPKPRGTIPSFEGGFRTYRAMTSALALGDLGEVRTANRISENRHFAGIDSRKTANHFLNVVRCPPTESSSARTTNMPGDVASAHEHADNEPLVADQTPATALGD